MAERRRPATKATKIRVSTMPYIPEDLLRQMADGLSVYHGAGCFVFSFLQAQYPVTFTAEQAGQPVEMQSKCVAQILVPDARMVDFARAVNEAVLQDIQIDPAKLLPGNA